MRPPPSLGRIGVRTAFLPTAMAVFLAVALPAGALAQVCLGSPTARGQFALTGEGTLSDSSNNFGVGVEANLPGPLAFRAGISLDDRDNGDRVAQYQGRVSYDIRSNGISICPVGGADYSRHSDEGTTSSVVRIPIGIAVGGRLSLTETGPALIPSVRAGIAHRRFSRSLAGETETSTDNSVFAIAGGSVSRNELFVRGEAGIDSARDVDPFYRLTVGVRF